MTGHRTLRVVVSVADFGWKSTAGFLVAVAVGAVAAFGGQGLVDAGVQPVWIWAWAIASFASFTGGLCFWAASASKRWAAQAADHGGVR